ncbi:MAG: glycoside hydrolase family 130 protein [Candidatus Margulisiibacteriota bacterium]
MFFNNSKKNNGDYLSDSLTIVKNRRLDASKPKTMREIGRRFKRFSNKKIDMFSPDKSRVITKFSMPSSKEKLQNIISRILSLSEDEVVRTLRGVYFNFSKRHRRIEDVFRRNFMEVMPFLPERAGLSDERKLLIGAYFTMEYAIESAALFNPSIVIYPKQNDLKPGQTRVLLSFRATGEGHISSIVFRSAVIDRLNDIFVEPISRYVGTPEIILNSRYDKKLVVMKLEDLHYLDDVMKAILDAVGDTFCVEEMEAAIKNEETKEVFQKEDIKKSGDRILWLLKSNYEILFSPLHLISERVIFPVSPTESNGVEDARFVRFVDDDKSVKYFATYTAYNGLDIMPQLIETNDFHHFKMKTLNGSMAKNKGMALFPRKINGRFAMVGRSDGESLYLMYSDNIDFWYEGVRIISPEFPWEIVQIGNCGSPIETEKGWIMLTHGVGPMRKYCIGAVLLDLNDPSKVIGHLKEPLIVPAEEEREGYVPNVVYTCGAMILNEDIIIPYATSDSISHIAIISVKELLGKLAT